MNSSPKIGIGVCTRGRPAGLAALLESFSQLLIPEGFSPLFIIVENHAEKTLQHLIDPFASSVEAGEVIYETESRLGIPFARNAVLDLALANACEALALVDDDEIVDPDWLVELHREMRHRNLQLVGGPVRILPAAANATFLERWIWRGVATRFAGLEARALRKCRSGNDREITIVTSSWLACLHFLKENNLRFDESLGLSGGSDTRFFRDFIAKRGISGWAPRAIVREFWPVTRLQPMYQFRRGRDQAISHFHNSYPKVTFLVILSSIFFVVGKLLACIVLFPLALLDGGRSSVRALRSFGFAFGRMMAVCGTKSRHYAEVSR